MSVHATAALDPVYLCLRCIVLCVRPAQLYWSPCLAVPALYCVTHYILTIMCRDLMSSIALTKL